MYADQISNDTNVVESVTGPKRNYKKKHDFLYHHSFWWESRFRILLTDKKKIPIMTGKSNLTFFTRYRRPCRNGFRIITIDLI